MGLAPVRPLLRRGARARGPLPRRPPLVLPAGATRSGVVTSAYQGPVCGGHLRASLWREEGAPARTGDPGVTPHRRRLANHAAGPADHLRRGAAGAVLARRVCALSRGRHARVKARLRRASRRQRPAAQLQVCAAAARLVEVLLRSDRVQPLLRRPAAAARLPAGRPAARRAPDARRVHLRRNTERAFPRVPAAVAGPRGEQGRGRRASGEIARGATWACCSSGA
mmetsp:Transcript_41288/g.133946  ORF Transcript_41288/g.133946 Transcript_41288/m.133946 type:complete len:225 (+) Transcript_41288:461-1135(+)